MTSDPGTFLQHRIEQNDYFFLTFSRKWIVGIHEAFTIGFNMNSSHFNSLIIDVQPFICSLLNRDNLLEASNFHNDHSLVALRN